jgi:hypothetical protein
MMLDGGRDGLLQSMIARDECRVDAQHRVGTLEEIITRASGSSVACPKRHFVGFIEGGGRRPNSAPTLLIGAHDKYRCAPDRTE